MKKIILLLTFFLFSIAGFSQVQTMYWFGGAGSWSDLSHWSFQSGGGVHPTLGLPSSVPTADTHVIFDANSGLNGTGTTTAQLNARTVTLNAEVVIKSLTFDSSLAPHSPRIKNDFHIHVAEDVILQSGVTFTNGAYVISMEPVATTTSTLTLNGGNIPYFQKAGEGTVDIVGQIATGRYNVVRGTANYAGAIATFSQGSGNYSILVENDAVFNMPNLTDLDTRGHVHIRGTAQFNAPLLKHWTRTGTLGNSITIQDNVHLNLPSLETWEFYNMASGTATATITIPDNTIVTAKYNWAFIGNLNAGTSEFHIEGTEFRTKNGTIVHKVFMDQVTPTTVTNIHGTSTINELHFVNADGHLVNNMTIGKLYVAPSRNLIIYRNSTITINEDIIDSTPDCEPFWQLYSNDINYIARINNTSGNPIELKNAALSRINVIGGVINVEGIDVIDNATVGTTLNFIEPAPKTIYWVGDAGDDEWNNQQNWAATSGGPGGFCLPTMYDVVIFDDQSVVQGTVLNITGNSANMHDLRIEDNFPKATLTVGNTSINMNCYGSWYMKSGMTINSPVLFASKELGETITSNGSVFNRNVTFRDIGGWTLQDDFAIGTGNNTSNWNLYFNGGTLNTNNQSVYIGGNFIGQNAVYPTAANGGYKNLILGSSEISAYNDWRYGLPGNTLDAGTSHIILRYGSNFHTVAGHTYYDVTSYPVTPTTANTITVIGANVTYNNFHIFNQTADFQNSITANEIRMMPVQLRANILFRGNVTTNIFEIQSNGIFRAFNNTVFTVNQDFITHTGDCMGLMEMYVNGKAAGQKFTLKAANNVHIPNVWMTGVNADLSTGATYTATGLEDIDVTNWTFTTPAAKELYWLGTVDNNWNNGLNWTTNSDGTSSPGGCVPTKYDNVHFNSFSTGNLPIHILDQPAYFNNLIAHNDAPAGITITYPSGLIQEAYSYGNLIQMGEDMFFARLHLLGDHTDGQLINNGTSTFANLTVNNSTANWTFTGNMRHTGTYTQTGATVTVNADSWTGNTFSINGIALNLNLQTITGTGTFTLTKGDLKASDLTMTVGYFSSTGSHATNHARSLDIRNSTIRTREDWLYYGLATATLQAEGSHITFDRNFYGKAGDVYGTIETDAVENSGSGNYLRGGITADAFIVNESKSIIDNNTFGTVFVKPRGLTLWVNTNSTQTVTEHLYISGTPCSFNILRAGTETGGSQSSATATINYTNSNPTVSNADNTFDYVRVGGINASNSKLFLQVNASDIGLNTNVESVPGTPGLIGLGTDITCQQIDGTDPTTYTITAEKFYAGPEATFVWYKKNDSGVFVNLGLPTDIREIDVRDHGYDGVYKIDIIYDPLNPTVALRCPQTDEITVSYNPEKVILDAGTDEYRFCGNSGGMTVADFVISAATQAEITARGAELKWYSTATGGTAFNPTDIVVAGNYYAELLVPATNCVSLTRTLVNVIIDEEVVSNAGPSQTKSDIHPILFTMAANNPAVGTGEWVVVSGDVTITNTTAYNTTVTLNSGNNAELKWVVTNGTCTAESFVVLSKLITPPMVNPSLRMRVSQ